MLQQVAQMRREDHRAARQRIEEERWEWETDRLGFEQRKRDTKEMKKKLTAPYDAAMKLSLMTDYYGGGATGRKLAAHVLEIKHELEPGSLLERAPAKSPCKSSRPPVKATRKASQTKSNQVKPSPAMKAYETRGQEASGPSPSPSTESTP